MLSVVELLRAAGVDVSAVASRAHPTRRARLAHGADGRRDSPHYARAEWHAATEALAPPLPTPMAGPAVAVMTAMPAADLARPLDWARAQGASVVVDTSEVFATRDRDELLALAGRMDLFAPSREETRVLLPGLDDDAALAALARRCPRVAQKRGADGLALLSAAHPAGLRVPARPGPMDEPFGALDAKLREAMQVDLKKLVQRLGITTVFVTHDQDEALTLSDRIAVMQAGLITQVGGPLEIYDRPASAYVADFVGRSNLIEGDATGGRVELGPAIALPTAGTGPVTVVIRPEHLAVSAEPGRLGWPGTLAFVKHAGATTEYEVDVGRDRPLRVVAMREAGAVRLAVGARVVVELKNPAGCVVLPGRAGA